MPVDEHGQAAESALRSAAEKAAALSPSASTELLVVAFQELRKAITHATGPSKSLPTDVAACIEPKDAVLTLFLNVHEKKKIFRRQVEAVCILLLQHPTWSEALHCNNNLLQRWRVEMPSEVQPPDRIPKSSEPSASAPPSDHEGLSSIETTESKKPAKKRADETTALFYQALADLESNGYSISVKPGLEEDDVVKLFENLRRGTVRVLRDPHLDATIIEDVGPKAEILQFLLSFRQQRRLYRRRVDDLLAMFLESSSWQAEAIGLEGLLPPKSGLAAANSKDAPTQLSSAGSFMQQNIQEDLEIKNVEVHEDHFQDKTACASQNHRTDADGITEWDNVEMSVAANRARDSGGIGALYVRVIAAYNLVNADWWSLSDPYVIGSLAGCKKKTAVIDDDLNPCWDADPWIFDVPNEKAVLNLHVFDKDAVQDDPLGDISVPVSLLQTGSKPTLRRFDLQNIKHGEIEVELQFVKADNT